MAALRLLHKRDFHSSGVQPAPKLLDAKASAASKTKLKQGTKAGLPPSTHMTTRDRIAAVSQRAQQKIEEQRKEQERNLVRGGLASSSAFGGELYKSSDHDDIPNLFDDRNPSHMAQVLNPRPSARARWQRRMVIRHIRHAGRLNKEMKIARTERQHLLRSHFFKTSMKKLAPLARQIAGKSIDEAILQMRFSKKKVAQEVRQHLIQARNEAIVMKGMGLQPVPTPPDAKLNEDPSETRPLPHQTPMKTYKKGHTPQETDIYVAEAWTNRGPYGSEPDFRARGRVYEKRPPHTGISVVLKEEKTRLREAAAKEAKALRKRMGKNMWVHLPDRKITAQRQHVLW
ncbi:hypothetical protein A1O3_01823 [Capronia epimyces CBS 606.96]|uniref:Mitochondrial large ribosomal subunit n=1 Tax=Capronia epimyces CBS 606.96 TaxID=1182542 RepID=W9Z2L8_9EURO|nr:uncharacterized protein A1O3_01823 [Capronia epimyces CBS 606.96]EXJ88759.1 hypothetical protein A1O3_01823 [Capronia epimyces CBS 606.96]